MTQTKRHVLSLPNGFTLIELLVTLSISTLLITFGVNSYNKAQQRQLVRSATDSLLTHLETIHQDTLVGKRPTDCIGKFQGYLIQTTANTGTITTQPICANLSSSSQLTIPNLTFVNSDTFTFKPLASGFDLGNNSTLNLDYIDSNNATHRFLLYSTGSIEDQGVIE